MTTPSVRLQRACGWILWFVVAGLALVLAAAWRASAWSTPGRAALYLGLPSVLLGVMLVPLLRRSPARVGVLLMLVVGSVAVAAAEGVAFVIMARARSAPEREAAAVARADGRVPDDRTRLEVVLEERAGQGDAVTLFREPWADAAGGRWITPLGGLPDVLTVMCNEDGRFRSYAADRHGFNNPDSVWDVPIRSTLVGDSFVQGQCVDPDRTLAAHVGRDLGPLLNLGLAGNGPLRTLGSVLEFLPQRRPGHVVWVYYDNDLLDLEVEKRLPALISYLDGGTQGLENSGRSASGERRDAFESALRREAKGARTLRNALTLTDLRDLLGLPPLTDPGPGCCDLTTFRRAVVAARDAVQSWGGCFHVVQIPAPQRLGAPEWLPRRAVAARDSVARLLGEAGVGHADAAAPLAQLGVGGQGAFVHRWGHLTGEGYAVVASTILDLVEGAPCRPAPWPPASSPPAPSNARALP